MLPKRLIGLFLIFLGITVLAFREGGGGYGKTALSLVAVETVGFVIGLVDKACDTAYRFWEEYFFNMRAREENSRLMGELQIQKKRLLIYEESLRLYKQEELLASVSNTINYPTTTADIIGYEPRSLFSAVILNKGSRHGVARNMPVVSHDGIIGRIITVSPNYSKLMPIMDINSAVGATIKETEENGVLVGYDDHCLLKYIPLFSQAKIGDEVITSGIDGIFPRGLKIGVITQVSRPKEGSWCHIVVLPSVNLSKTNRVLIILKEDELSKAMKELKG